MEAKLQSQSQPATPPPIHAEPTSFELPKSAQELRDTLRQIYLETIYTQKVCCVIESYYPFKYLNASFY